MADKRKKPTPSSSYSKDGKQLSVDDLREVMRGMFYGNPSSVDQYMRTVSPVAEDRFMKTEEGKHVPIYKYDQSVIKDLGYYPGHYAAYYPRTKAVFVNPEILKMSGPSLESLEKTGRTIGHEMIHAAQDKYPKLTGEIDKSISEGPSLPQKLRSAFTNVYSQIDPSQSAVAGGQYSRPTVEYQANYLSGTAPDFYAEFSRGAFDKIVSGDIPKAGISLFKTPAKSVYVASPESTAVMQRAIYPQLPVDVQKRLQSLQLPLKVDGKVIPPMAPAQPAIVDELKGAYDKFMSIIGLGAK